MTIYRVRSMTWKRVVQQTCQRQLNSEHCGQFKIDTRTQAVNQMKALVVTAPNGLRETLDGLTVTALTARCKNFRPGRLEDPTAAAKYALRSLGRYFQLDK